MALTAHMYYSASTYRLSGFHVASGDKIQTNVHWLAGVWCVSWPCICRSATSDLQWR